jgi:hypothetical protein
MALRIFSKENIYMPLESLGFGAAGLAQLPQQLATEQ